MLSLIVRARGAVIVAITAVALLLLVPALALAADDVPRQPNSFALPVDQLWAIVAGGIAPLITYVLNRFWPKAGEEIKSIIFLIGAAVAGGIAQAITAGNVGFNDDTLQFVIFAVVAAIGAHMGLWTRSPISARLRGVYVKPQG